MRAVNREVQVSEGGEVGFGEGIVRFPEASWGLSLVELAECCTPEFLL